MDNLARNAMLARQAGMSYGKWKALQPIVPIQKKQEIPEGWNVCKHCGKPIKPKTKKKQTYCEVECQKQAYREQHRKASAEYIRRYREKKAMEGGNGDG